MDAPIGVRMANKFACHSEGAKRPKNPHPLRPVRPYGRGERIATGASALAMTEGVTRGRRKGMRPLGAWTVQEAGPYIAERTAVEP